MIFKRIGSAMLVSAVWAVVTQALIMVCHGAWSGLHRPGPTRAEDLVALVAALMGLALCGWLAISVLLCVTAELLRIRSTRCGGASRRSLALSVAAEAVAPVWVRRLVALTLGASIVTGVAITASPATALPLAFARPPVAAGALDPGWVPTPDITPTGFRSTGLPPSVAAATAQPGSTAPAAAPTPTPTPTPTTVVVRRGDCLWDIAARHLGRGASDAAIAEAWPRWYHANRAVIGADPDALTPGTRLTVPEGVTR